MDERSPLTELVTPLIRAMADTARGLGIDLVAVVERQRAQLTLRLLGLVHLECDIIDHRPRPRPGDDPATLGRAKCSTRATPGSGNGPSPQGRCQAQKP